MKKNAICPICGEEYTDYPAISRKDNETEICPECGRNEAILDYINYYCNKKGVIND